MEPIQAETDETLATRARDGDLAAFDELVRRHHDRVWRFLFACCRNPHTAADLVQETFITAYRRLETFDARRRWLPWLLALARNKWRDHLRARPPQTLELNESLRDAHHPPDRLAVGTDTFTDLWEWARRRLPPLQFQVLWHRYHEELSVAEIAEALDLTRVHVKVLLFRARQTLARSWKNRLNTENSTAGTTDQTGTTLHHEATAATLPPAPFTHHSRP